MKNYWAIVRGHPRPARFLAARLLTATGACRLLTITQPGFVLRFHPANLSSQLWIDPRGRDEPLAFFRHYLKPGDVVVDVGANIGDTVLAAAAQVGPTGRVIAIEPHPRTFRYLQDNVALNRVNNVETIGVAAGAAPGTVAFSNDRRDDMNRVDGGPLQVRVERLDDLVRAVGKVALLKIDVEGYEKFVLEGAPSLLQRTRCVHFEVSALHFPRFGYRTRDVLGLLSAAGFSLFRIAGPARIVPITLDFDTEPFENLLALRDGDDFAARTGWTVEPRPS
jgi:FkbM family methyltransferase